MARARAGLIELCQSDYHRVVCFLMYTGRSQAAAQAAAQEAFADWWSVLKSDPAAWGEDLPGRLVRVRVFALGFRPAWTPETRARRPAEDGIEPGPADPGAAGEPSGQVRAVLRALRELDEGERRVMAFALDGFTPADTAQALRMTAEHVQAVSKRARASLRKSLAGHLPGDDGVQDIRDPGTGGMTDERLGQFLSGASRELLGHVASTAGVADVFGKIMNRDSLRVPLSAESAPAAVVIRMRVHARGLAAAIGDAFIHAIRARSRVRDRDPDKALAAAGDVGRALSRARDRMRALGPEVDLSLDLGYDMGLAGSLASVLADGGGSGLPRADDLATALADDLGTARVSAKDLVHGLAALPVNAAGADLSGTGIKGLGALDGVTWTRETTWPSGIASQVRAHSREIRPGVYEVRSPYGG